MIEVAVVDRANEGVILLFLVDCAFLQKNFDHAVKTRIDCGAN
jgi:hypothetical protein